MAGDTSDEESWLDESGGGVSGEDTSDEDAPLLTPRGGWTLDEVCSWGVIYER